MPNLMKSIQTLQMVCHRDCSNKNIFLHNMVLFPLPQNDESDRENIPFQAGITIIGRKWSNVSPERAGERLK